LNSEDFSHWVLELSGIIVGEFIPNGLLEDLLEAKQP
jgi:hypothetical protein